MRRNTGSNESKSYARPYRPGSELGCHRRGPMPAGSRYILISPVRNEERYVTKTLDSVIAQTCRPAQWIIVDDNSDDGTTAILEQYARRVDWITVLKVQRTGERQPGSPVIRAFNAGYALLRNIEFDFIVKLDCDLDLPSDYFGQLMARF